MKLQTAPRGLLNYLAAFTFVIRVEFVYFFRKEMRAMIEVKGVESCHATGNVNPQCELVIHKNENPEINVGDEVLVLISRPIEEGPEYGVPLRILDKSEPEENEILVQYGDRVFVGQKIPEFI
jgi:hypothetical protein